MLELEADHRRHAEIENAIRDLKHGVGLNHLPSGRFASQRRLKAGGTGDGPQPRPLDSAHRSGRAGGDHPRPSVCEAVTSPYAKVRITRSALPPHTEHLPQRWPWEAQFDRALARLRALPTPCLTAASGNLAAIRANRTSPRTARQIRSASSLLLRHSPRQISPSKPNIRRRSQSLPAATEDRLTGPPLPQNRARTIALPLQSIARSSMLHRVIPSVDLGLGCRSPR